MKDLVVVIILIGVFVIAIKGSIKHFRGESSCCGGTVSKPVKKKLKGNVTETYNLKIEGMHCQNCVNRVTEAVNTIEGASAKVNLRKNEARIVCDRAVELDQIIKVIERKGFTVKKNDY